MHHALRLRLLVQRLKTPSILSPENCGVVMHSLRLLDALSVRDAALLHRIDAVIPHAGLRSRANVFHCLCCCAREQEPPRESLPAPLAPLLARLQSRLLREVDDLSPTECVLVMEAVLRLVPLGAAQAELAATLRSRAAALAAVVERPVELVGVARIVAEALQMPGGPQGWGEEMREVARAVDARLDDFGRRDLLALVDAIALRIPQRGMQGDRGSDRNHKADNSGHKGDEDRRMSEAVGGTSERRALSVSRVPDECRPLLEHILSRVEALAARLSPSQVVAWISRLVALGADTHSLFPRLLARLEEPAALSAMSPAQLSMCLAAAATHWQRLEGPGATETSAAPDPRCRVVCTALLTALLSALRDADAVVAQLIPLLPLLPVMRLTPAAAADCATRLLQVAHALRPRDFAAVAATVFSSGAMRGRDALLREWCDKIQAKSRGFNARDALQVLNEAAAVLYADSDTGFHTNTDTGGYDAAVVRPLLTRLHEIALEGEDLSAASTAQLARYLSSMSKLGVRRKADYYRVIRLLETRQLTAFEQLRVLGVVARHHLSAVQFMKNVLACIPTRAPELHARQKCLLLKYLGQARAQRIVKAPVHHRLTPGVLFASDAEIAMLAPRDAIFALVGLVELRQFCNPAVPLLLRGPLAAPAAVNGVRSAATLGELAAALSRLERGAVPEKTLCAALSAAARRLPASRSFFVDVAPVVFWMRLVRLRHAMNKLVTEESKAHAAALAEFQTVAAAIAEARLLDMARATNLRKNTFLFHQLAVGYRLGVALPRDNEALLARHLDTRSLPQLLSDPRQVVDAVTTALHIAPRHAATATEILRFAAKNFGSLGVQEALLLGTDVVVTLQGETPYETAEVRGALAELLNLARRSITDPQRQQRLSVQERAFGVHHGLLDGTN